MEPLEQPVLAHLQEQRDQRRGGGEPYSPACCAGGKAQGGGQMGLARAGVADQQHIFFAFDILAAKEFPYERLVERRPGSEVEGVDLYPIATAPDRRG